MDLLPSDSSDDLSNELQSESDSILGKRAMGTANIFEDNKHICKSKTHKTNNRQLGDVQEKTIDSSHRIRSFPHIHGRWPCSIYIHIDSDSNFSSLQQSALTKNCTEILKMKQLTWEVHKTGFHASLSKEFTLLKHQLNPFVESIKKNIESRFHKYTISFTDECVIHTNPESTRSFIGLIAHGGTKNTISIIESINNVLEQFSLPPYYKNPSIHVSIASAVGNIMRYLSDNRNLNTPKIIDRIKCKKINHEEYYTCNNDTDKKHISTGLQVISNTNNEELLEMSVVVNHIIVKTGHILNRIDLKT